MRTTTDLPSPGTVVAEVAAAVALQAGLARLLARAAKGATDREDAQFHLPTQATPTR